MQYIHTTCLRDMYARVPCAVTLHTIDRWPRASDASSAEGCICDLEADAVRRVLDNLFAVTGGVQYGGHLNGW